MALAYDLWFPNGAVISDFAALTANGAFDGTPDEDPARCYTTTDPLGSGQRVLCLKAPQSDATYGGAHRTTLDVSDGASNGGEPICDWAGSPGARRWYRFCWMARSSDWVAEPQQAADQFCVVWQLHDYPDTSPADASVEPVLWLKESRDGRYIELWNCSDANSQTATGTRTYRKLYSESLVFDTWHEWIIWMKPSYTSGDLKIWRNRRQVFGEAGKVNCFNNDQTRGGGGNVPMLDCYNKSGIRDRTVYHKGIQIGDESYSTFNEFLTACGSSDTELEGFVTRRVSLG